MHRPRLGMTHRWRAAALAASALVLAGCGQNSPGVAAEVAGEQITDEQVDDFAQVLCALNADPAGDGGQTGTKSIRHQALQILLGNELALDLVDPASVDKAQVDRALAQATETRETVPASLRPVFDDVVRDYATAQLGLTELGRESLRAKGKQRTDDETAFAEGDRLRTEYAKKVDVSVDPRFGTVKDGVLTPGGGSLSVPVSETAVQGEAEDPSGAGDLPVSQTCT